MPVRESHKMKAVVSLLLPLAGFVSILFTGQEWWSALIVGGFGIARNPLRPSLERSQIWHLFSKLCFGQTDIPRSTALPVLSRSAGEEVTGDNTWQGHLPQYFTSAELQQAFLYLLIHIKSPFLIGQRLVSSLEAHLLLSHSCNSTFG